MHPQFTYVQRYSPMRGGTTPKREYTSCGRRSTLTDRYSMDDGPGANELTHEKHHRRSGKEKPWIGATVEEVLTALRHRAFLTHLIRILHKWVPGFGGRTAGRETKNRESIQFRRSGKEPQFKHSWRGADDYATSRTHAPHPDLGCTIPVVWRRSFSGCALLPVVSLRTEKGSGFRIKQKIRRVRHVIDV